MPFKNTIIGGQAALVRAAEQSPNFVSGQAGWQIAKTGSAEFNNMTVRGVFTGADFLITTAGLFFYGS